MSKKIPDIPDSPNYKIDLKREKAVTQAIEFIKKCPYKGTGIKIELEAHLGRDGGSRPCVNCNGAGEVVCMDCEGEMDNCPSCKTIGTYVCSFCKGVGRLDAAATNVSESYCQDFIIKSVTENARNALVYSKTYNDGSVDTEFTFTLPIDKARYAVEFIEAFKKLSTQIGATLNTQGAGMHICILNSPDCYYPRGNSFNSRYYENFRYSMTKLLPALYFLASPDYRSRRLNYRPPIISQSKYSSINASSGCFEYRIFETCYERPYAILDDICIIANTLKYFSYKKKLHSFFGTIGKVAFYDVGQGLERFYQAESNYKALLAGVNLLKPSYKSLTELKKERNFKISLTRIKQKDKIKENKFVAEYISIKRKADAERKRHENRIRKFYEQTLANPKEGGWESKTVMLKAFPSVDAYIKSNIKDYMDTTILEETEKSYVQKKKDEQLRQISSVLTI